MARVRELAGRRIEQHSSPNAGGSMSDHRGVVLHIAQGSYRGTIDWQLNPDQRYESGERVTTSSTWIVGQQRGKWVQMVDSDTVAWAQRDGSRTWLSIELEGFAPAAPSSWQVEACAQLLAWSARTYRHPIAIADHPGERGLGHHAMDREWRGEQWGHDQCPGDGVLGAKAAIVARARQIQEEDDMPTVEEIWEDHGIDISPTRRRRPSTTLGLAAKYAGRAAKLGAETVAGHQAILAAVQGQDAAQAAADAARAAVREELAGVVEDLAQELAVHLPGLTEEQIGTATEAAVRNVLGGLDEDDGEPA